MNAARKLTPNVVKDMSSLKDIVLQELMELERQLLSSETLIETSIREPESGLDAIVLLSRNSDSITESHRATVEFTLTNPSLRVEAVHTCAQERKLQLAAVKLPADVAIWGIRSGSSTEVLDRKLQRLRELGQQHNLPHIIPDGDRSAIPGRKSPHHSKQLSLSPSMLVELECYGRIAATVQLIEDYDELPERQTFSIYGTGTGCLQLLKSICSHGCRPTALADGQRGSIYILSDIPDAILAMIDFLSSEEELLKYLEMYAEIITEDLNYFVSIPTDILFLNEPSCIVDLSCMSRLSSKYVIESFFSFCTAEAASLGSRKGIRILPRLLSSAGEAIARYHSANLLVATSFSSDNPLDQLSREIRNLVQEGVVAMQNLVNAYDLEPHTAIRYLALTNRKSKKIVQSKRLLYQSYSPKRYRLRQVA